MKSLKSVISRINNWFYYKKIPSIVDWLVSLSLVEARKKIQQRSATRILVDNSVIAHGVTHETFWKSTGEHAWGDSKLTTGHIARLPVYDEADDNRVAKNVRYLGPITHLAMEGTIHFFSSPELDDERLRQPFGRYRGYGLLDYTLFRRVSIGRLEDMSFYSSWSYVSKDSAEEQRQRLKNKPEPLYRELVSLLGEKHSQDAWHLFTAERNDCFCFLTMDFKFANLMKNLKNNDVIKNLRTRVLTPEEFGKIFEIKPIPSRFYSYHDANGFVDHTTNWENSRRNSPRRTKK